MKYIRLVLITFIIASWFHFAYYYLRPLVLVGVWERVKNSLWLYNCFAINISLFPWKKEKNNNKYFVCFRASLLTWFYLGTYLVCSYICFLCLLARVEFYCRLVSKDNVVFWILTVILKIFQRLYIFPYGTLFLDSNCFFSD